jgi:hypothetical protein
VGKLIQESEKIEKFDIRFRKLLNEVLNIDKKMNPSILNPTKAVMNFNLNKYYNYEDRDHHIFDEGSIG